MKYAINIPNFGLYGNPINMANLAIEAEKAGWDGFFLWDHLVLNGNMNVPFLDPWISLTTIAMRTEKIKIGPFITPIPRRRPWKLAREAISLDHLSNGRLILGVGLGTPEKDFTTFGESFDLKVRATMLDEGLDILKGLWTGQDFSYEGEYYQVKNARFLPTPINGNIPIWVAGMWPYKKPFQRAAKYDGACPISANYPDQLTHEEVRQIIVYIRKNRINTKIFDVIITGETPNDPSEGFKIVEPYRNNGVTWWCENINGWRFSNSLEKMRERIRQGPPKEI